MKLTEKDIHLTHYGNNYFLSIPTTIYKFQELKEYILKATKLINSDGKKYDYDCHKCNCKFNIQSDKDIKIPVDKCPFCGSKDIT